MRNVRLSNYQENRAKYYFVQDSISIIFFRGQTSKELRERYIMELIVCVENYLSMDTNENKEALISKLIEGKNNFHSSRSDKTLKQAIKEVRVVLSLNDDVEEATPHNLRECLKAFLETLKKYLCLLQDTAQTKTEAERKAPIVLSQ